MHKRTQLSQLSTKYTEPNLQTSSSSYLVSRKRDMFHPLNQTNMKGINLKDVIEQNGSKMIPKNVLVMNPSHSRSISWPQIFMPDQQLYVALKGNFYTIRDSRNKQRFIQRKSMADSNVVYFNVQKNNDNLIMVSVQKCIMKNKQGLNEIWYHVDLVIWDVEDDEMERRWAIQKGRSINNINSMKSMSSLQSQKSVNPIFQMQQQFKSMQLIDSYKKALIVFDAISVQQLNKHQYEIVYIDFHHNPNKSHTMSTKYIPQTRTLNPTEIPSQGQTKIVGRQPLERFESQSSVKLINSDYGDIILLVTSQDIYQLQVTSKGTHNQHSMIFKPLNISKKLIENKNTYTSINNIANLKQSETKKQLIIDAKYIPKSLKVLILTSHGRVMVIQSEQCIFTESLYELLSPKDMLQLYNIENFLFKNINFLNGLLIVSVEAQKQENCNLVKQITYEESILDKLDERKDPIEYVSRGIVVAKVQSNSLSFSKFISLPFQLKLYSYVKIHTSQDSQELLIQTISNKNVEFLELYKCQIISNKNTFIPFSIQHYLTNNKSSSNGTNKNIDLIDNKSVSGKVTFGKSQRILYKLKDNQISCYHINTSEFANIQQSGIKKIFSTSFFQKPIKLMTNPLTGQVFILFREFIKIFSNIFTEFKLITNINIRDVKDFAFSRYGESIVLVMNDNTVSIVDSYTFKEKKVLDFPSEIKQISYPTQYLLSIKNSKNILSVYQKKLQPQYDPKTNTLIFYEKLYEIKTQVNDLYYIDETITIVLKQNCQIQIYSHVPEPRVKRENSDDNQQLRYEIMKNQHPHLINKKTIALQKNDSPTYLFYSSQFTTVFIGTKFGHIHQCLYPFLPIQDPNSPQSYKYQVSSSSIIHIEISADFQSMYTVSENGEIMQLKFQQYLNGMKKNGVYVVSKTQNTNENMIKYEFANRNYLMDSLTTINTEVAQNIEQKYEEICFVDDKIKNDIEDITTKIKNQSHKQINKLSSQKKTIESQFKSQFNHVVIQSKGQQKMMFQKLQQMRSQNEKIKQELIQNYEKQLLQIYRENDRLKNIMTSKMNQFTSETQEIKQKMQKMKDQQDKLKQVQLQKLQQSYQTLGDKYNMYSDVANQQINQNENQLQQFLKQQMQKYTQKFQQQQKQKQHHLSQLGKIQKEIQKFKKRSIYFQNLIVQTRNQIEQLSYDVDIYQQKKQSLIKQLQDKSSTIELKQTQIIGHLKKTTQMKKIKNIHEFQLQEFQAQIIPVQNKISQLQQKVQQMNHQIMVQFNSKVQQTSLIQTSHNRIQKLKLKNKQTLENSLNSKTQMQRFIQALSQILMADPFAADVRKRLSKVIDNFSKNKSQSFTPNYDIQREKKHSQHLIRKKNIILKSIQRQEKLQQGVVKNKNQFFRFYSDNTNLVKQYNQLFKDHNLLNKQKIVLQQKINSLKQENHKTPVKRTISLHSIKKVSATKLTPFQRYEQEQVQLTSLKLKEKDTTETRLTRGESSSSFLKSLIKDASIAQNKNEKSNLIRDRIRTFVNPEFQRQKQIQRKLFQRQKGKSSYMPALKL